MLNEKEVVSMAREIRDWVENAVGDMAYTSIDFLDARWQEVVKEMRRDRVGDIKGALADRFYEDEDTLADLTGDRIYDAASGEWADMVRIAMEIRSNNAHRPLRRVMSRSIARWRKMACDHNKENTLLQMHNAMDYISFIAFGHPISRAWETECCLKCGIKQGNPPASFWDKGFCDSCITTLETQRKEAEDEASGTG